jgi:hypothetical protein
MRSPSSLCVYDLPLPNILMSEPIFTKLYIYEGYSESNLLLF